MARAILDGRKTQTRRIAQHSSDCPFGAAGDRLWVREPWARKDSQITYAADLSSRSGYQWRASYLMQRDGSRSSLQIMSIATEHLKEISAADAIAEGCPQDLSAGDPIAWFA